MKVLRDLWANKHTLQGRVDITLFYLNTMFIVCHLLLMIVYVYHKHTFMICVNAIGLLYYISFINKCYKNPRLFVSITFLEIWTHMLLCISVFGYESCFQNWSFGLIAASFLPIRTSTNIKAARRMSLIYAFIVISTYFLSPVLTSLASDVMRIETSDLLKTIFIIANNSVSFFSIIMFALFYSIRAQRREYELTRKADYDELTKLYNRYAITEIFDHFNKESSKEEIPFSIAMLDIDFFKKVNDTYGHNSGDIVLKEIANIIKSCSNREMIIGRWGGEEFILLASHTMSYNSFRNTIKKINSKVEKTKFKIENNTEIKVTVSIGCASVNGGCTITEAITKADERLYQAKNTGRNKVVS